MSHLAIQPGFSRAGRNCKARQAEPRLSLVRGHHTHAHNLIHIQFIVALCLFFDSFIFSFRLPPASSYFPLPPVHTYALLVVNN